MHEIANVNADTIKNWKYVSSVDHNNNVGHTRSFAYSAKKNNALISKRFAITMSCTPKNLPPRY